MPVGRWHWDFHLEVETNWRWVYDKESNIAVIQSFCIYHTLLSFWMGFFFFIVSFTLLVCLKTSFNLVVIVFSSPNINYHHLYNIWSLMSCLLFPAFTLIYLYKIFIILIRSRQPVKDNWCHVWLLRWKSIWTISCKEICFSKLVITSMTSGAT